MENLIPRKVIIGQPDKENLQISPCGKFISYLANFEGTQNIFIEELTSRVSKVVSFEKTRNINKYEWSPCGNFIVYPIDPNGSESYNFYLIDLKSNLTKQITHFTKAHCEISAFHETDSQRMSFVSNHEIPNQNNLYEINLESLEIKKLYENIDNYVAVIASPDFKTFVGNRYLDNGNVVFQNLSTREVLLEIPKNDTMTTTLHYIGKGNILYFMNSLGRDKAVLSAMNLVTKEVKILAKHDKADFHFVTLWNPKTREPLIANFHYKRREHLCINPKLERVLKTFTHDPNFDLFNISSSNDGKHLVGKLISDRYSEKYVYLNLETGEEKLLYHVREVLNDYQLKPSKPIVIESRDSLELVCYHTEAYDRKESVKDRALIIYVHGGPWTQETWSNIHFCQIWSNRGYDVIAVNYRSSTGFGKNFINAGDRQWSLKMHDDVLDVVNWAIVNQIAAKDKIAIWGGSYGGFETLVSLTFTPEVFACGVDFVGPSNLETLLKSFPPHWASFQQRLIDRVGDFKTDYGCKFLRSCSPLFKASNIIKPLLIIQGSNDPRVLKAESDTISEVMELNKIPHTYLLFPDEGHGCNRYENWQATLYAMEVFFAKTLGGRVEPKDEVIDSSSLQIVKNSLGLEL